MSFRSAGEQFGERLRVALVVPPFVRVPPEGYGGTELVVADLAEALAASGHEVTLFATGDSHVAGCETRWLFPKPLWPPEPMAEWNHAAFAALAIAEGKFDIVHCHTPALIPLAQSFEAPVLHTIHHAALPEFLRLYNSHPEVSYVCISRRQAELMSPAMGRVPRVVHHGLNHERYLHGDGVRGDALFLGRFDEVKAPHLALQAARAAGVPLRLVGRTHDHDYFDRVLSPMLKEGGVEVVGELGGAPKLEAIASARVLIFPSTWEEPFGLSLIEAMLCGTPVVALRRGAIPEIVEDGITGVSVDAVEDLGCAVKDALRLDRATVRARALERFALPRMVGAYLRLYSEALRAAGNALLSMRG